MPSVHIFGPLHPPDAPGDLGQSRPRLRHRRARHGLLSPPACRARSRLLHHRGRPCAHICRRMDDHLILTTYREVLESENRKVVPLSIHIENEIPIAKGCGSSAAASPGRDRAMQCTTDISAGKADPHHWRSLHARASSRQRSACWMGGITVARMANQVQAQVVEVKPKAAGPCCSPFRRAAVHRTSPPRLLFNIRAPTQSPTSEFHASAGVVCLRPTRPSFVRRSRTASTSPTRPTPVLSAGNKRAHRRIRNSWRVPSAVLARPCSCFDPKANPKRAKQRIAAHLAKRRLPPNSYSPRSPPWWTDGPTGARNTISPKNRIGHHRSPIHSPFEDSRPEATTGEPAASLAARRRHNPVRGRYTTICRSDRNHARRTQCHPKRVAVPSPNGFLIGATALPR